MNRVTLITTLFNNDINTPLGNPDTSPTSTRIARAIEQQLQSDVSPLIQQYQDGMISTGEFYHKLTMIIEEDIKLD